MKWINGALGLDTGCPLVHHEMAKRPEVRLQAFLSYSLTVNLTNFRLPTWMVI